MMLFVYQIQMTINTIIYNMPNENYNYWFSPEIKKAATAPAQKAADISKIPQFVRETIGIKTPEGVVTKSVDKNSPTYKMALKSYKTNVDPYMAHAISDAETGDVSGKTGDGQIGKKGNPGAYFHLNPNDYGRPAAGIDDGVPIIKEKLDYGRQMVKKLGLPDTPEYQIQAFNGYGKIKKGHYDLNGATSIYGVPIPDEGIDFKKTPLYGKRVVNIMNNLKANKYVSDNVEAAKEDYDKYYENLSPVRLVKPINTKLYAAN